MQYQLTISVDMDSAHHLAAHGKRIAVTMPELGDGVVPGFFMNAPPGDCRISWDDSYFAIHTTHSPLVPATTLVSDARIGDITTGENYVWDGGPIEFLYVPGYDGGVTTIMNRGDVPGTFFFMIAPYPAYWECDGLVGAVTVTPGATASLRQPNSYLGQLTLAVFLTTEPGSDENGGASYTLASPAPADALIFSLPADVQTWEVIAINVAYNPGPRTFSLVSIVNLPLADAESRPVRIEPPNKQ
jgi:hypothetical protein